METSATISDKTKVTLGFAGSLVALLVAATMAYARIAGAEAQLQELRPRVDRLDREREGASLRLQRIEDKIDALGERFGEMRHQVQQIARGTP